MRSRRRKKGILAIKVDMEKAYDRLDWKFLRSTLISIGIREEMVNLIMACTSCVSMRIIWNGVQSSAFQPTRGVRQGDPLSPYLFVLCMERLGHLINRQVREGHWKGFRFNRHTPTISHLFFADDLILFGEATKQQIEVMRNTMASFCAVSGHQISLNKSKAFFSRNVHFNRAIELSNSLGIGITGDLGKYLGVPLLHHRLTKASYVSIIQKTKKRLTGWKGKCLTMAGRAVLIKSVISALPSYHMQTMLLPVSILQELEKISRTFLWNQGQEGRKMHLISWDQIKQSKDMGGLGIKDLRRQNIAFIMRLCWEFITRPDALWVQCLKGKYNCGNSEYPVVCKKTNSSAVWRSIVAVWGKFYNGVGRILKGGGKTNVWWDLWTPLEEPLIHFVEYNFHNLDPCDKVRDFVLPNGEWNIVKWKNFLPEWVVNIISKGNPPRGSDDDPFCWRYASDGNFSVQAAYKFLAGNYRRNGQFQWKQVWKLPVPEKVKIFLWQVIHDRLPTNSLRVKRGLSDCADCQFDCQCEETILHILRDCEIARTVWLHFVSPNLRARFFRSDLQVWLKENMTVHFGKTYFRRWLWRKVFSLVSWVLWKNRCKGVMEGARVQANAVIHSGMHQLMDSSFSTTFKHQIFQSLRDEEVKWRLPSEGYVRLDTDGSVNIQGAATCGGIVRDDRGKWIVGFQRRLQFISPTSAEVIALLTGLQLCKQYGFQRVAAYTDSLETYQLIMREGGIHHPLQSEITVIRDLIYSEWDLELHYAPRVTIKCADYLAKEAHSLLQSMVILPVPPPGCIPLMREDLQAILGYSV